MSSSTSGDPLRGLTVLVVEDDQDNLDLTVLLLRSVGADAIGVDSADAARASLATRLPSMVITDLGLPDEDGLTFVRSLRASDATRNVRVIALTGDARPTTRATVIEAGFDAVLIKPISPDALYSLVRETMQKPSSPAT